MCVCDLRSSWDTCGAWELVWSSGEQPWMVVSVEMTDDSACFECEVLTSLAITLRRATVS